MTRSIIPFTLAFASLVQVACSSSEPTSGSESNDSGASQPAPGTSGNDAGTKPIADASTSSGDTGALPPTDDASAPPLTDAAVSIDAPTTAACANANTICLSMTVPASVDPSKVSKLYIGFAQTKGGIPEIGKGTTLQPFTAQPGQTMPLTIDNKGLSGSYYVNIGLYMQGGGTAQPKSGVDYSATTSQAIAITSAATTIPEVLVLTLAP